MLIYSYLSVSSVCQIRALWSNEIIALVRIVRVLGIGIIIIMQLYIAYNGCMKTNIQLHAINYLYEKLNASATLQTNNDGIEF